MKRQFDVNKYIINDLNNAIRLFFLKKTFYLEIDFFLLSAIHHLVLLFFLNLPIFWPYLFYIVCFCFSLMSFSLAIWRWEELRYTVCLTGGISFVIQPICFILSVCTPQCFPKPLVYFVRDVILLAGLFEANCSKTLDLILGLICHQWLI